MPFDIASQQETRWRGIGALAPLFLAAMFLLSSPAPIRGQHAEPSLEGDIGTVDFQVSCDASVRDDFDRAVALLHHMMYERSRAEFEAIAGRDPACAMAHWGIAMTLFHPLWHSPPDDDLRRGWTAVSKAEELQPATERERALLTATAVVFADPDAGGWWPRLSRWAAEMEKAHRAYPRDVEIAAFYALSRLGAAQVAEDRMAHHAEAAKVLLRIHERVPTHPGATHYTIHANDVSGRADQSLDIVRAYDEIAPTVPHALHMPTHIFVRLGAWPDVIEWNRKSAAAALRFPAGDRVSLHYPHAMDYLLYAHLQRGEDGNARAVLDETLAREKYEDDFASAFHLAAMPARHAIERRAWKEAAAIAPRTPGYVPWDRYPWAEALSWFGRGLGAARVGDAATAREAEARMAELRDRATEAGEQAFASYIEIDRLILSSALRQADGDLEGAAGELREAAELERTVQKHPVTPGAILPPYEALGDLLMASGKPEAALQAYESSLETWPARYSSLLGAARASRDAGMSDKAREYYSQLLTVVGDAETDRSGVREAKEQLAAQG